MHRKFEKNEPYQAVRFFLKKLVPDHLDRIKVEVFIRHMSHQDGQCWSYRNFPTRYTIVVNSNLGRYDSLRALAHESVHIAQYMSGKMKDVYGKRNRNKVMWKKELMDNVYDGAAYRNSPWEVEARSMQEKLLRSYLRYARKLRKSGT